MTLLFPMALVQSDQPMMPGPGTGLVWLAIVVLTIAGLWKVFEKAGKPGWAAIVPIYNLVVLMKVAGKPLWWVLLMFIPFINIVVLLLVYIEVAHRFGKSTGFGWGMTYSASSSFPCWASATPVTKRANRADGCSWGRGKPRLRTGQTQGPASGRTVLRCPGCAVAPEAPLVPPSRWELAGAIGESAGWPGGASCGTGASRC